MSVPALSSLASVFANHVNDRQFPCLAAKTALAREQLTEVEGGDIRCGRLDGLLAKEIAAFAQRRKADHVFHSLVIHFPDTPPLDEIGFEKHLFERLEGIHHVDRERFAWDPSVSADPSSPNFSMSVGGKSFYVIGLHPGASRAARRLAHPALVFNLHAQFEYLRSQGRYHRLREAIIERDRAENGSVNPMLAVHGESSEALQYSGRHIEGRWRCPFDPTKASA